LGKCLQERGDRRFLAAEVTINKLCCAEDDEQGGRLSLKTGLHGQVFIPKAVELVS
jgi:hypothetical protein